MWKSYFCAVSGGTWRLWLYSLGVDDGGLWWKFGVILTNSLNEALTLSSSSEVSNKINESITNYVS